MATLISILVYLMMGAALAGLIISYFGYKERAINDTEYGALVLLIFFWPLMITAAIFYLIGSRLWYRRQP